MIKKPNSLSKVSRNVNPGGIPLQIDEQHSFGPCLEDTMNQRDQLSPFFNAVNDPVLPDNAPTDHEYIQQMRLEY